MENVELARNLLFGIVVFLILMIVVIYFVPYISKLAENAQQRISPPTEEPKEEVLQSKFGSLGIIETDPPEIKMFKLIKNFDPLFLNDQSGSKCTAPCIMYNSFVLNLYTNTYGYNDKLIKNLTKGLKDFSVYDRLYQIGPNLEPDCNNVVPNGAITYNNDCWDASINNAFIPCIIYVNGDALSHFNGKVKIRVVWYKTGATSPDNGKEIIKVLVTVCDG